MAKSFILSMFRPFLRVTVRREPMVAHPVRETKDLSVHPTLESRDSDQAAASKILGVGSASLPTALGMVR